MNEYADWDPVTGEVMVPQVEVGQPEGIEWEGMPDSTVRRLDELEMTPDEIRALSLSQKQEYLLEIQGFVVHVSALRYKLSREAGQLKAKQTYVRLMDRSLKDGVMTTAEAWEWGRERIKVAHELIELAKKADEEASLGRLVQALTSVTSALQTSIRAEMAESSLLP